MAILEEQQIAEIKALELQQQATEAQQRAETEALELQQQTIEEKQRANKQKLKLKQQEEEIEMEQEERMWQAMDGIDAPQDSRSQLDHDELVNQIPSFKGSSS